MALRHATVKSGNAAMACHSLLDELMQHNDANAT
jgi:hypothetical protein